MIVIHIYTYLKGKTCSQLIIINHIGQFSCYIYIQYMSDAKSVNSCNFVWCPFMH